MVNSTVFTDLYWLAQMWFMTEMNHLVGLFNVVNDIKIQCNTSTDCIYDLTYDLWFLSVHPGQR